MRWLVHSNLYVAACAASLAWVTYVTLGIRLEATWPPPAAAWMIMSATSLVYNLDRLSPAAREDVSKRGGAPLDASIKRLSVACAAIGAIGSAVSALWLPWEVALALAPAALIAIGYAVPSIRWRGEWMRLKEVPGAKILLIALVWSFATVSVPAWEQGIAPWSPGALGGAATRGLFIFALAMPFDVRDRAHDQAAGIVTIPAALGVAWSKLIALAALALGALLEAARLGLTASSALWPTCAAWLVAAALIAGDDGARSTRYYAVYLEGVMALYAALVMAWSVAWGEPLSG